MKSIDEYHENANERIERDLNRMALNLLVSLRILQHLSHFTRTMKRTEIIEQRVQVKLVENKFRSY